MDFPERQISIELLTPELVFAVSRSSGPGGQNVNKVNSKVTVNFDISNSSILTQDEKNFLLSKLSSKITVNGVLTVSSQESRSQQDNKATVLQKLSDLLERAYIVKKKRKSTKPSKAAKEKRMKSKRAISEKKQWRQKRIE